MRKLVTLLLLLPLATVAQRRELPVIDSLIKELPRFHEDTNRVNILAALSNKYSSINSKEGLRYGNEALALSQKLNWPKGAGKALLNIGLNYDRKNLQDSALDYYQKALNILEPTGNKLLVAKCYNNTGLVYKKEGEYGKALEYCLKALKMVEGTNDKEQICSYANNVGIIYEDAGEYEKALAYYKRTLDLAVLTGNRGYEADALHSFGSLYNNMSDYPKALEYYQKALAIDESLGDKKQIANVLNNMGSVYMGVNNYEKALEYYQKALPINEFIGNKVQLTYNINNIGVIYDYKAAYPSALEYYEKALKLTEETGDRPMRAGILSNVGAIHTVLSRYPEALRDFQAAVKLGKEMGDKNLLSQCYKEMADLYDKAPELKTEKATDGSPKSLEYGNLGLQLAIETGSLYGQQEAWKSLSRIYENSGNYAKALETYRNYINLNDSISGVTQKEEIARKEVKFVYEKREDSLRFQKQVTEQQLKAQTLLAGQQKQALLLNKQQLALANKEKELQHLAYLKTQADLQAEQSKRQEQEKALTIADKERTLQATTMKLKDTELALKERELQAGNRQRNMTIAGVSIILMLGAFSFYRYRKQKRLEKYQAVLNERLRISRDLHDDMGATLSSISVYSSAVKQRLRDSRLQEAHTMLDTISEDAQDMVTNMSDMVWMINPQNDTMDKLFDRMQLFASNVLSAKDIFFQFKTAEHLRTFALPMEYRKNLFLIFKEAINNVAKYSGASEVSIDLEQTGPDLHMYIKDNGCGFDIARQTDGNGLRNMKKRTEELAGTFRVDSGPGRGTAISVTVHSPKLGSKQVLN